MQLNYQVGSAPVSEYSPLPEGSYPGQIVAWEEHHADSGNQCLKLQVKLDNGRTLFHYLVMQSPQGPDAKAIAMAKERLDELGRAFGLSHITEADQLLAKPLTVRVGIDPPRVGRDGKQYDASNSIKGYAAASMPSQGQPAAAASAPPAPQPVSPTASSTPWS